MKRIFSVLLAAALLLSVVVSAGLLVGCNSDPTYDYKYGSDYLATEDLSLTEPLTALSVHWINGSVEVVFSDVEGIHIYEDEARDECDEHSFYYYIKDDTTLMIEAGRSGDVVEDEGKALVIEISRSLTPMLDQITVNTEGADVTATALACRALSVESVSGDITCDGAVEELVIATVSGETTLSLGGVKTLEHSAVSGNLSVSLVDCTGYTAMLDTVTGQLTCEDAEHQQDGVNESYVYGDGSVALDLITITGDATVVLTASEPPVTPDPTEVTP